jgi:transcriptional regulator with XRE-family HTH domain
MFGTFPGIVAASMAGELSDDELGKRLSAGRGYRRETLTAFAERIDVERHDLSKWERGEFGSENRLRTSNRKRDDAVKRVIQGSGLPPEFFSIDLQRLPDMVTAWQQVQAETPAQRDAALERDESMTLPPSPSAKPSGEQAP